MWFGSSPSSSRFRRETTLVLPLPPLSPTPGCHSTVNSFFVSFQSTMKHGSHVQLPSERNQRERARGTTCVDGPSLASTAESVWPSSSCSFAAVIMSATSTYSRSLFSNLPSGKNDGVSPTDSCTRLIIRRTGDLTAFGSWIVVSYGAGPRSSSDPSNTRLASVSTSCPRASMRVMSVARRENASVGTGAAPAFEFSTDVMRRRDLLMSRSDVVAKT